MRTSLSLIATIALLATSPAFPDEEGISLEELGAVLQAARMIEEANGGVTVDLMELLERGNSAIRQDLDRHSGLLDAEAYREARIQHQGEFAGIGIRYAYRQDHLLVRDVFPNGPAAKVSLLPGDQILAVDGQSVAKLGRAATIIAIRGRPGTKLLLRIRRRASTKDVELVRQRLELPAVTKATMLDQHIGYCKLVRFHGTAEKQLRQASEELLATGMEGLILDLRGNPGGATEAAIRIAGLFLEPKSLVAQISQAGGEPRPLRTRNHHRLLGRLKIACLIDGATASSAEILAASLRDNGRAILVGQRSFGKGTGQETARLLDGTAMRMTNARYFTPKGEPIHNRGLTPDLEVPTNGDSLPAALDWLRAQLLDRPGSAGEPPASGE